SRSKCDNRRSTAEIQWLNAELCPVCNLSEGRALLWDCTSAGDTPPMATDADTKDFHEQLKAILPRLRVYALSLTRDRDAADDLVHDTVVKALSGRASFEPGTNLSAWVFRIQRNEFISGLRRLRPTVPVDSAVAESLSHQPHQESRLVMREFM